MFAQHGGTLSGFLAHHGAHLLLLGGPVVLLAAMFTALELTRPGRTTSSPDVLRWWLAPVWAAAAAIHLAVVGEHLEESALLGAFFLVLGAAQCAYAVAVVVRVHRRLLLVGLTVNLAVVLLWVCTRTVGIPFVEGSPEPVGPADLVATVLELATVVLSWIALRRPAAYVAHGATTGVGARPQVGSTTAS